MSFKNTTGTNFFDTLATGRATSSPFVDIFMGRDPLPTDVRTQSSINTYAIQQKWLNTTTNELWELKAFHAVNGTTEAVWIKIGGANGVEDLQGNVGGPVPPTANIINVVGDGTFITTIGTPATSTLLIQPAGGLATVYTEDVGTAVPSGGNLNVFGATVAAGTHPLRTTGAGNTITIDAQISQAIAASDATKIGLSNFDSASFSVDANGFVTMVGHNFNYTNVTHAMSPYTVLASDYYLSVDCSGGTVVLDFPNAPAFKRQWIVKDRTGNAAVSNITLTTPGGVVTFDGLTTYTMNSNYQAINLLANATPTYEVF